MDPVISILIVIGLMTALTIAITFICKLLSIGIKDTDSNADAKLIILVIISVSIILSLIAFTNYNPNAGNGSNIRMVAPLPYGFEAKTEEELKKIDNQLTKGESRREKQKKEAEERQMYLEKQAIKKGKNNE